MAGAGGARGSVSGWRGKQTAGSCDRVRSVGFILGPESEGQACWGWERDGEGGERGSEEMQGERL